MVDRPSTPIAPAEVTGRTLVKTAAALGAATVAIAFACGMVSQSGFSLPGVGSAWTARMLRISAAGVVGAGLAVAGAALQSLLRNPLASPFILVISSGAGVGVLVGMTVFSGSIWLGAPTMAAAGASLTVATVYMVAQRRGRLDPYSLLLTGVIVNAFNGAIMLFIYLYVSPFVVTNYISWAMGLIPEWPDPALLAVTAGVIGVGWGVLFGHGHAFNVQSLGDDVATSSGVNVHRLRLLTFATVSIMTAAAVALAGPVGFVGLIVPHICRLIVGVDHRRLIVAAGFVGASFLIVADTFCRCTVLEFGLELPVGIITALCGGPFFLFLLRRRFGERTR